MVLGTDAATLLERELTPGAQIAGLQVLRSIDLGAQVADHDRQGGHGTDSL